MAEFALTYHVGQAAESPGVLVLVGGRTLASGFGQWHDYILMQPSVGRHNCYFAKDLSPLRRKWWRWQESAGGRKSLVSAEGVGIRAETGLEEVEVRVEMLTEIATSAKVERWARPKAAANKVHVGNALYEFMR